MLKRKAKGMEKNPRRQIKKNSKPNPRPKTREELDEHDRKLIFGFMTMLSEHVSCARLVGTKVLPNGKTVLFSRGFGDLLAQVKAAEIFLDQAEAAHE